MTGKKKKQSLAEKIQTSEQYAWNLHRVRPEVEKFELLIAPAQTLDRDAFMTAFANLLPSESAVKAEMKRIIADGGEAA